MKNSIIFKIFIGVFVGVFCLVNSVSAQQPITISAIVVNNEGNPLEGVKVVVTNDVFVFTDVNGKFEINVNSNSSLTIEKDGYVPKTLSSFGLPDKIVLDKDGIAASINSKINLGVTTQSLYNMVGAVSSITTKDHIVFDNTQWIRDYIDGLLTGVRGSSNIRGLDNALFVIDGIIGRNPDLLNMDEVDQITVLKDASAIALYGSQAKNGVIVINTKRGGKNKKIANVNIRTGVKKPISLPKYLHAVEYMELYNEARLNDGLDIYFSPELMDAYRHSNNPYRYPDVNFYSDEYLRSFVNSTDVVAEFGGGNEKTQYYVNAGWNYDQSLVKLNPDVNVGANRFNIRGNIDFTVTDFIKSSLDVVEIINTNKSSLSDILYEGLTFKPNSYAPLLPVFMVDTISNNQLVAQLKAAKIYDGMLLGGSQVFREDNPVAKTIAGGYQNSMSYTTQFNNSLDFDLDMITSGLSAKTYLSFDFYDAYDISVQNKYRVYEPTWEGDKIVALTPYGDIDQKDLTEHVSTRNFISRVGFYGLINYEKNIHKNHFLNATMVGYVNTHKQTGNIQTDKNAHLGLQLYYDFKKKLLLDFNCAYINSIKLPEGQRGGFSPTLGLAYILSEEDFIKNLDFINFLKLRASGGVLKSDLGIPNYYLYEENYFDDAWFYWAEGAHYNIQKNISQGRNYNMTFEGRRDLNLGFEGYLWNSLQVEFNYFKMNFANQLTRLENKYPSPYNVFRPYENYNEDVYQGFEFGFDYRKNLEAFSFNIGGNLLYSQSKVKKRPEIHAYDYLKRVDKPVDAIFGLIDDGFYALEDFAVTPEEKLVLSENLPIPSFGKVQPGDIKYRDLNEDNVINDNDVKYIGQWNNPWSYSLNLRFKFKGFNLFILGVGQFGGEGVTSNDYYWVDGNDKYSEIVLNRWTPKTADIATFPRLSSQSNTNNFRTSTFWLYNNSFFDIRRVQLTYEFGKNVCEKLKVKNLSVNIAGANLLEFSSSKNIRQLNLGGEPQYRYFTLGLRTSF